MHVELACEGQFCMWQLLIVSFVLLIAGLGINQIGPFIFDTRLDETTAIQQQMLLQASMSLVVLAFAMLAVASGSLIWRFWYVKRRKLQEDQEKVEKSFAQAAAEFQFEDDEFIDDRTHTNTRVSRLLSLARQLDFSSPTPSFKSMKLNNFPHRDW
jgi:uncharacterized membrane protein YidH (DUF202 family)